MGKHVKVKFSGVASPISAYVLRDVPQGVVLAGYMPEPGEIDPYGDAAYYHDELWVEGTDDFPNKVCQLSDGFELVEA